MIGPIMTMMNIGQGIGEASSQHAQNQAMQEVTDYANALNEQDLMISAIRGQGHKARQQIIANIN